MTELPAKPELLVVDDDEDLLWLMTDVLVEAGFSVETAENGQKGLESVARRKPDLILLDMKMPVMDGWQFARELGNGDGQAVPIIVVTAADDARRRAEEIGAVGWLGKPFDIESLVAVVRRHVQPRLV